MTDHIVLRSRATIPKLIQNSFLLHRDALEQKLQQAASRIHFSIDMWTAPSRTGFQAIVAHFVEADSKKLIKALLSLREFKGSHGGEEQARVFLDVVDLYKLRSKIGYFTMDNADSNDNMLRYIAREIPDFDAIKRRIRCNGHVMNLAAQAFLFHSRDNEAIEEAIRQAKQRSADERSGKKDKVLAAAEWRKMGPLGQLHNLVVFIRSSTTRYQDFKAKAGRSIPLDNDTRWNSWWLMIHVALRKKTAIMEFVDDNYAECKDDWLSRDQWQELKEMHDFLVLTSFLRYY